MALGEALLEAVALAKRMDDDLKGTAIFNLPIKTYRGKLFAGGTGLPVYMMLTRYPKASYNGVKISFLTASGDTIISTKGFKYNSAKPEKIKEGIKELAVRASELEYDEDISLYKTIKSYNRVSLAAAKEMISGYRETAKDYENLDYHLSDAELELIDEQLKKSENLVMFFSSVGTVPKIEDTQEDGKSLGQRQYLYVAKDDRGYFFRTKLNSTHTELYELLINAKADDIKTGLLSNKAGGYIFADENLRKVIKQAVDFREYSPAAIELMRGELEKAVQKQENILKRTLSPKL